MSHPVSWDRVARLVEALAGGDAGPLQTLFRERGSRAPEVVLDPAGTGTDAATSAPAPVRFALDWWQLRALDGAPPPRGVIDPLALGPALGHVALVEPDGAADFRYRLYGTCLASLTGADLTGRLVSRHPASGHVVELLLASYAATRRRRAPLLIDRRPAGAEWVSRWSSLVLPFAEPAAVPSPGTARPAITRLMVVAVATDRVGRILSR